MIVMIVQMYKLAICLIVLGLTKANGGCSSSMDCSLNGDCENPLLKALPAFAIGGGRGLIATFLIFNLRPKQLAITTNPLPAGAVISF